MFVSALQGFKFLPLSIFFHSARHLLKRLIFSLLEKKIHTTRPLFSKINLYKKLDSEKDLHLH